MRSITRVAVAAAGALLALALAPAPDAAAQNLARVYHVTPKDAGAFEAALAKHVKDRMEHGDPWSWDVLQVVVGEDLGDFVYRSGGHTWADFDAYDQGFGAQAGLHYQLNVDPLVEDADMWITTGDTVNSRMPADDEWPDIDYVEVITYHVVPGRMQQFNEAVSEIHGAIESADWPVRYAWVDVVSGGKGPARELVLFFEDWADFEQPETPMAEMLNEELGEDRTQEIFEQFGNAFRAVESRVLHWRKDLSIAPPGMREGEDGGTGAGGGQGDGGDGR